MVQVRTNLSTRESARLERFEPAGNVTATNVQSAIQQVDTEAASKVPIAKNVVTLTAPGPYAALPTDDVLIVKQLVAAPFRVNVDWSLRTKSLRVVDGKGDANINNITIAPAAGQTQLTVVNYSYVINGIGGSITLTPLPDGSGAY